MVETPRLAFIYFTAEEIERERIAKALLLHLITSLNLIEGGINIKRALFID